jgi:hypothetical protein
LRFDVEVRQPETFGSQPIEPGRRCSPDDSATVEAGLTPPEVVHEDQDDVRFVLSMCGRKAAQKRKSEYGKDRRFPGSH